MTHHMQHSTQIHKLCEFITIVLNINLLILITLIIAYLNEYKAHTPISYTLPRRGIIRVIVLFNLGPQKSHLYRKKKLSSVDICTLLCANIINRKYYPFKIFNNILKEF